MLWSKDIYKSFYITFLRFSFIPPKISNLKIPRAHQIIKVLKKLPAWSFRQKVQHPHEMRKQKEELFPSFTA